MTNTVQMLSEKYGGATIPLESVSNEYFSVSSKREIDKKSRNHEWPFPVLKLGGQRSPWVVYTKHFAEYLDKIAKEQKSVWSKCHGAG